MSALALAVTLLLSGPAAAAPAPAHNAWTWRHHHVTCQRIAYHGISIVTGQPIHGVRVVCHR